MTVLAWDGSTLAADKLADQGGVKKSTTKIFKVNGHLLGVSGNLSIGMELIAWWSNGANPEAYPPSNRSLDDGARLIAIGADKKVMVYEISPHPFQIEGDFCAFGCGSAPALAAMDCGADARRAVEIACKYDTGCGNGVDVLAL